MKTPNNSDSKFVAVIGAEPGDVIEEVAANVAKRAGAEFSLFDLPDDMIDRLTEDPDLGFTKTLAILCTTFAGRSVLTSIRKLRQARKTRSRVIVRATLVEESGDFALDCIAAGACDYLVRGSYRERELEARLARVLRATGQCAEHAKFRELEGLRAIAVFIATPYSLRGRDDYENGISAALGRLSIPHLLSTDEKLFRLIIDNVSRQIDDSTVVIANISSYGESWNPNVFLEIGYSINAKKRIILIQRDDDLTPLPADILGKFPVKYTNCADLALQLYFGFGGTETKDSEDEVET